MDRELAEHLAKDTGLRPEEIDPDATPLGDVVVDHLAEDAGLDSAEVAEDAVDPVDTIVGRLPID